MRKGDREEVRRFTHSGANYIYNMVYGFVLNKEDTEEIVQDSLLAAMQGLHKFKNESSLFTWLYKIAMNKAKDKVKFQSRKKRSGKSVELHKVVLKEWNHPGIELESKEEVKILLDGIDRLPEKQKTALVLAKFDHKTYLEIGLIMNLSDKAVESLVARAKVNFKKYIGKIKQ